MANSDGDLSAYMGREIISGLTTRGDPAVVYFAEGRSSPSRRRRLEPYTNEGRVYMNVNSETSVGEMKAEGGIPELLLYNAMRVNSDGLIVVSNGFQTDCDPMWKGKGREKEDLIGITPGRGIFYRLEEYEREPRRSIYTCLLSCGSEVDPLITARIAFVADFEHSPDHHHIGIIIRPRDANGKLSAGDKYKGYSFHLENNGEFIMSATYGVNDPPYDDALPPDISSLQGFTKTVNLDGTDPGQLVDEVWEILPEEILVGVTVAMRDTSQPSGFKFAKKNMKE